MNLNGMFEEKEVTEAAHLLKSVPENMRTLAGGISPPTSISESRVPLQVAYMRRQT